MQENLNKHGGAHHLGTQEAHEGPTETIPESVDSRRDELAHVVGAMSLERTRLTESCDGDSKAAHEQNVEESFEQPKRVERRMPIMLATSRGALGASRVMDQLDGMGISYSIVFVDGFKEPRLQVGSAELVGESEIFSHLDEIRELATA